MSALLKELAVIALALLVSAAAVLGLRDRGTMVPPPETVVEEFVRDLSLERWGPAHAHLSAPIADSLGPDSLAGYADALQQRVGRIADVHGRPFFATDEAAEATAEITTEAGDRVALRFPLSREQGLWKIARL